MMASGPCHVFVWPTQSVGNVVPMGSLMHMQLLTHNVGPLIYLPFDVLVIIVHYLGVRDAYNFSLICPVFFDAV